MSSFLQTDAWAKFKEKWGWRPHRLAETLVLSRKIILGKSLWYAPETELVDEKSLQRLLQDVKPAAEKEAAFVFRLEVAVPWHDEIAERLKKLGLRKSFESVQPEWRAVVDLRPSEEELLATMHPKGRYNIRLAQRHGVAIRSSSDAATFYSLYVETAKRERFSPRSREYFVDLLATIPRAQIFVAQLDHQPLAAALVVFHDKTASYLYGASSRERREVMAPYLLHWEIMREAKKRGCTVYNLGEIPPLDVGGHPLQGLGDFKMKFGANPVHLLGSWDYVYRPLWYTAFRVVEKLRRGFRA